MSSYSERVEKAICGLCGDMDHFRLIVTDKDELLRNMCDYAEYEANRQRREPWAIISEITGHGSGVSSAVYDIYRRLDDEKTG